jgi:hypothetical protein
MALPDFGLRVHTNPLKFSHGWGTRLAGDTLFSQVASALNGEPRHTPGGDDSDVGMGNIVLVPLNLSYNRPTFHRHYEDGYVLPSVSYDKNAMVTVPGRCERIYEYWR